VEQLPINLEDLKALLILSAPVFIEVLKRVKDQIIPSMNLPWPMSIVVKAGLSALVGAAIAWLTGLGPGIGAIAGGTGSVGYAIARPKTPKEK